MPIQKKPELITFVSTPEMATKAVNWGANHLILDDDTISIRSWANSKHDDDFKALNNFISFCKQTFPKIKLSVNCDALIHTHDFKKIDALRRCLDLNPVDYIRVQDVGLIHYFSEKSSIPVTFCAEMGNANWPSISAFSKQCKRQNLSMDLPYSDILDIQEKTDTEFDIQVQGPVLIQYSHRRFLAGLSQDIDSPERLEQIHRIAEDEDYPGRRFTFLDNHHGHFMYAYFDRCLLMDIKELCHCNCQGWIIDARGESENYLKIALSSYKEALNTFFKDQKNYIASRELFNTFKKETQRPQKPGFFRANQTDRRRFKKWHYFLMIDQKLVKLLIL